MAKPQRTETLFYRGKGEVGRGCYKLKVNHKLVGCKQ